MAYCFVLFVLVSVDHGKCFTALSLSNARAGVCGVGAGLQRKNPPCSCGGTLTAMQAQGCRITVSIVTIYMLKSCLPQQSDKHLKILYIIESTLFLIYKVNYLY